MLQRIKNDIIFPFFYIMNAKINMTIIVMLMTMSMTINEMIIALGIGRILFSFSQRT